jgi:hypothetical protein
VLGSKTWQDSALMIITEQQEGRCSVACDSRCCCAVGEGFGEVRRGLGWELKDGERRLSDGERSICSMSLLEGQHVWVLGGKEEAQATHCVRSWGWECQEQGRVEMRLEMEVRATPQIEKCSWATGEYTSTFCCGFT